MIDKLSYESINVLTFMAISSYIGRIIGEKIPANIAPEKERNSQIGGYAGMFASAMLCLLASDKTVTPLNALASIRIGKALHDFQQYHERNRAFRSDYSLSL